MVSWISVKVSPPCSIFHRINLIRDSFFICVGVIAVAPSLFAVVVSALPGIITDPCGNGIVSCGGGRAYQKRKCFEKFFNGFHAQSSKIKLLMLVDARFPKGSEHPLSFTEESRNLEFLYEL